jgi:hypothetical protein
MVFCWCPGNVTTAWSSSLSAFLVSTPVYGHTGRTSHLSIRILVAACFTTSNVFLALPSLQATSVLEDRSLSSLLFLSGRTLQDSFDPLQHSTQPLIAFTVACFPLVIRRYDLRFLCLPATFKQLLNAIQENNSQSPRSFQARPTPGSTQSYYTPFFPPGLPVRSNVPRTLFLTPPCLRHDQHLAPRRHPARPLVPRPAPLAGPLRCRRPRLHSSGAGDPLEGALGHTEKRSLATPVHAGRERRPGADCTDAIGVLCAWGSKGWGQQVRSSVNSDKLQFAGR